MTAVEPDSGSVVLELVQMLELEPAAVPVVLAAIFALTPVDDFERLSLSQRC